MITVKSAKQTLTGNFEINGYCLMEDEKPVENIANGSKLWELNTGNNYVFDEENGEWIKVKKNGGSGVKTKTYTGTLDTLFDIDHIKEYYEILNNDAIGIMTSENMPGVNMALNIITNPQHNNSNIVVAGTGLQGSAFVGITDFAEISDNWPQTFETGSEFADSILPLFGDEFGLNITITVDGISGSDPDVLFSGVYVNTPASNGPHFYYFRQTSLIQSLSSFTLTFYYMNNIQPTITTETISSSSLATIFSDNNYTEEQFNNLVQDVYDGKAFVSIPLTFGNTSGVLPITAAINNDNYFLQLNASTTGNSAPALQCTYAWDFFAEDQLVVACWARTLAPNSTWQTIGNNILNNMTGQSSYDLIITRISDAQ